MKRIYLFLVFAAALFSAQNRFIYEYKFVSDSTNRENVTKELMYLDITDKGSTYYSRAIYVRDSTMQAEVEKQMRGGGGNVNFKMRGSDQGSVGYKVTKNYADNKMYLNTRIGMDSYKVLDDRTINWKILPEKQKIGEFEAQKATAEFAGRKWTAWFTEEIPFSDGPYKFKGLPGLVVKVEDATKSHALELKASTKYQPVAEASKDAGSPAGGERRIVVMGGGFSMGKEELEINRTQYKKLFWEDRDDPAKMLKMMQGREGVVMKFRDQNGNDISMADAIKKREESAKEAAKRNNNIIELDVLKR